MTAVLVLVALAGGGLACGGDDDRVEAGDGTGDTGRPDDGSGPRSADRGDLAIEVTTVGGLQIAGAELRNPPRLTVYADGTVIATGAVPAIYPGPAVAPLIQGTLDAAVVEELLAGAVEAGLDVEDLDPGPTMVADAGATRVTLVVGGETYVHQAEALGLDTGVAGLTEDQAAARRTLADFVAAVDEATVDFMGTGESYVPERYRVFVLPEAMAPQPVDGAQPDVRAWPLERVALPAAAGECLAVTGEDAATLATALAGANEVTRWAAAGGEPQALAFRPVLPHEPDCG